MKRSLVLFVVGALAVGVIVVSSAMASSRTSCPNGFFESPVPQTEGKLRELDRIDAGLDAGAYMVQELIDLGNAIDANTDGTFCLKAISNLNGNSGQSWGYFYGARDNDSAAS